MVQDVISPFLMVPESSRTFTTLLQIVPVGFIPPPHTIIITKHNVMTGYAWLIAGCSRGVLQRQAVTEILKENFAYVVPIHFFLFFVSSCE